MATKKQECMIIGAAPIAGKQVFAEFPPENYYVICADAGYETAAKLGVVPDLIVGDFDSASGLPPKGKKVLKLPVEKDVTDTMYAAMKGLTKGFRSFVLLGCLGGARFDHTVANLEVLQFLLSHGAPGLLADEHTKVFLIRESRLRLTEMALFPRQDYRDGAHFFLRNYGIRYAARGGSWYDKAGGGMWDLYIRETRAFRFPDMGFRAAYAEY